MESPFARVFPGDKKTIEENIGGGTVHGKILSPIWAMSVLILSVPRFRDFRSRMTAKNVEFCSNLVKIC